MKNWATGILYLGLCLGAPAAHAFFPPWGSDGMHTWYDVESIARITVRDGAQHEGWDGCQAAPEGLTYARLLVSGKGKLTSTFRRIGTPKKARVFEGVRARVLSAQYPHRRDNPGYGPGEAGDSERTSRNTITCLYRDEDRLLAEEVAVAFIGGHQTQSKLYREVGRINKRGELQLLDGIAPAGVYKRQDDPPFYRHFVEVTLMIEPQREPPPPAAAVQRIKMPTSLPLRQELEHFGS